MTPQPPSSPPTPSNAATIVAALRATGVTQEALAATIGCTEPAVWQVIHGRRRSPRIRTAIAEACGLPRAALFPDEATPDSAA